MLIYGFDFTFVAYNRIFHSSYRRFSTRAGRPPPRLRAVRTRKSATGAILRPRASARGRRSNLIAFEAGHRKGINLTIVAERRAENAAETGRPSVNNGLEVVRGARRTHRLAAARTAGGAGRSAQGRGGGTAPPVSCCAPGSAAHCRQCIGVRGARCSRLSLACDIVLCGATGCATLVIDRVCVMARMCSALPARS
ncbi:unnamed protein product [Leptosia nina]|uniref:Uncharacterized protein n=1 Tax=Leptosia nina TaxID=320188 RepID=A0AAV1JQG8_9NEOP